MFLHVLVIAEQAEEEGKSRGRAGRERSRSKGPSPPCWINSRIWSSVELLLKMESTKCTTLMTYSESGRGDLLGLEKVKGGRHHTLLKRTPLKKGYLCIKDILLCPKYAF